MNWLHGHKRRGLLLRIEAAEKSITMFEQDLKKAREELRELDAEAQRARLRVLAGAMATREAPAIRIGKR